MVKDTTVVYLYEIWETKSFYEDHLAGENYKHHLKVLIDYLQTPEGKY